MQYICSWKLKYQSTFILVPLEIVGMKYFSPSPLVCLSKFWFSTNFGTTYIRYHLRVWQCMFNWSRYYCIKISFVKWIINRWMIWIYVRNNETYLGFQGSPRALPANSAPDCWTGGPVPDLSKNPPEHFPTGWNHLSAYCCQVSRTICSRGRHLSLKVYHIFFELNYGCNDFNASRKTFQRNRGSCNL